MKNRRFYKLFGALAVFAAFLLPGCDFDAPLKEFFAQETGAITALPVETLGSVVMGTDGFVCVASDATTITIPVNNPNGYDFDVTLSEGTVQSASKDAIVIDLPSMTEGVDKTLDITVKTKDGRLLLRQSIPVALVNFDVSLSGLSLSPLPVTATAPVLVPGTYMYSVSPVATDFTLTATPANSLASVSMSINNGGTLTSTSATTAQVLPPRYDSVVTIRVTAPHGAKEQVYTLGLDRPDASNAAYITSFIYGGKTAAPGGASDSAIDHSAGTITLKGLPAGTVLRDVDLSGNKVQVSTGADFSVTTGTGSGSKKAHFVYDGYSAVNPVTITVTAEDGLTTKTYNVTVTRYPGVPTGVSIFGSFGKIMASWTPPAPVAESGSYELYVSTSSSAPGAGTSATAGQTGITGTTRDISVPDVQPRYVWVRSRSALDPNLVGAWSQAGSGRVPNRTNASIKNTFGISTTGTTGVTATFNAVHAYVSGRSAAQLLSDNIIQRGDYIDLEAGMTVDGTAVANTVLLDHGTLLRLIVVGINSFNAYGGEGGSTGNVNYTGNGNGADAHLVFQFQNLPFEHNMNSTNTSVGGYAGSALRKYLVPTGDSGSGAFLTGLTNAGVPSSVLWAPKRYVWHGTGSTYADLIQDKLWLPTVREMVQKDPLGIVGGNDIVSNDTYETEANQAFFEYYTSIVSSRAKYRVVILTVPLVVNGGYWLASPHSASATNFCCILGGGSSNYDVASGISGVAPAFCVK